MSWYKNWSDGIKKRACRYLLQRYLGQFLEEKLTLDQLTVDLYNGTGSVSDVLLDVQALNELGEQRNLPVEFVDGYISEMSVSIPWSQLLNESSYVEVSGLRLTVQPKLRSEESGSMFESVWSSMTSSMQLAAECLQGTDEKEPEEGQPMEGMEIFAQAIESILTRVKIKFINTVIRIEHLPKAGINGIAVEIRLSKVDYCDEASSDLISSPDGSQPTLTASFMVKKFHCEGVSFYTDEFPTEERTFSRGLSPGTKNEQVKTGLDPIIIGKMAGRQEIRIKLKQGETVPGPKVDLELNFGSITFILSPRQLHLLIELMQGLAAPHTQDTSNVAPRNKCTQKLMKSEDFEKVEHELQGVLLAPTSVPLTPKSMPRYGWTTSLDDSDDEFLPMRGARGLSESMLSDSSMEGSVTSTNTSYTSASKSSDNFHVGSPYQHSSGHRSHKRSRHVSESEVLGEVTSFHIRLASLAVVLLHEDILTLGLNTFTLTPPSVATMSTVAEKFFQRLGLFAVSGYGNKDFEAAKQIFLNACELNHIRLLAAALMVEVSDTGNSYNNTINIGLSAASLEVLECLVDQENKTEAQYVELIKFIKSSNDSPPPHFPLTNDPDLRLHCKRNKKVRHGGRATSIQNELTLTLQQCWTEFDLSMIDRVQAIVTPQQLCHVTEGPRLKQQSSFNQAVENSASNDSKFFFKAVSPFFVLKFRFPIPDLRPVHDIERSPWWERSVRKDVLYFHLIEPTVQSVKDSRNLYQMYQLHSREITAIFQEGDSATGIPFARATTNEGKDVGSSSKPGHFIGLPSITLKIFPKEIIGELEEVVDKHESTGLSQSCFMESTPKQPSPFMSKKIIHESETVHHGQREGEELVMPGDRQDMLEFINHASRTVQTQVDVNLPFVCVHFPTKHLYEVIYNRINCDLSLWQSAAPKSSTSCQSSTIKDPLYPAFSFCKSAIQYDSDSDCEETSGGIFYSAYEQPDRNGSQTHHGQSRLALNFVINQGILNINTNLRDGSGNIVPEQHGEVQINIDEASLFCVTYYKGIPQHNFVCLQINHAALYHKPIVGEIIRSSPLYSSFSQPSHLLATIYKSNRGVLNDKCKNKDMFTAAISTHINEHRVKTIRIACSLRGATLRHRVTSSHRSWLTQLMDFFDVVDYPVRGYDSPQVITELHQHFWDCAIDYRPLHIPLKSILSLGMLSISSNIAARTKTSTLRFIAEDANLFISDKAGTSDKVDLQMEYIAVMELGLFELSLRLSDPPNMPKVDLRASNNVLHIRTCADSAQALAQLITYFASDGDLKKSEPVPQPSRSSFDSLVTTSDEKSDNILSESTVEQVNFMMEDAMRDLGGVDTTIRRSVSEKDDGEVFTFPDEGGGGGTVDWATSDIDSDSDFCFLEHETGSGIIPKSGLPEIRVLVTEPVCVVDNHFSVAVSKADLLKPPKHYPQPQYRYTLRDMTLVWHMYGGDDFSIAPKPKKHVTIVERGSAPSSPVTKKSAGASDDMSVSYSYSRSSSVEEAFIQNKSDKKKKLKENYKDLSNWKIRGGPNRDHATLMQLQFNKVRFQHELYPEKATQASRQVLLINEFEIRDLLATSEINKFLYQYSSESFPKQSQANMVILKMVHLRLDPRRNMQETCIKVSLLPLRLNVDQDSLLFLIGFINHLWGVKEDVEGPGPSVHQAPLMSVGEQETEPSLEKSTVLIQLEDELRPPAPPKEQASPADPPPTTPVYIRSFNFSPEVPIRIDYVGKRVDTSHGHLAGVLMGLAQLSCLQIKLKRIAHRQGFLGFDKLLSYVLTEWIQDIKKTQLPSLIGGVGPMHSLVQLIQGIRDLFWLPIEQYQKDGRIVRGLQRGANSFTTSTAIAALELTARIVQAIQSVAEMVFDIVSPGPSAKRLHVKKGKRQSRFSHPADIREGVTNAIILVKEGLGETAETLVRVASSEAEQKGTVGAVGGVLRQIPPTMVAPIILASAATSNLLGGVRSQLAPDVRREASLKWKTDDP